MTKPRIGITLDRNETGEYSSYPWYALRENYCSPIAEMGGVPVPLPHFVPYAADYVDFLDGLVITGGDFDIDPVFYKAAERHDSIKVKATRTEFEFAVMKAALAKNIPILGICGGQQLINVAFGGTLIQHIPAEVKDPIEHLTGAELSHPVTLAENTKLLKIAGASEIMVNSSHHQAIKEVGQGLVINATAQDGVIEGVEAPDHKFCVGVQWHPEYLKTPADKALYHAFMSATQK